MTTLRIGTRKSALAKAQAYWVANRLQTLFPDVAIELLLIETSGDTLSSNPEAYLNTETSLTEAASGGLKALFTKEIEEALLNDQVDLAVHSLKDMGAVLPPGLILAAVPLREDPRDVWIGKNGLKMIGLPRGAIVATGAVRRQAQLLHLRPDLKIVPMRGNVDTRLRKLETGEYHGMILALAGLKRLGRQEVATDILTTDVMLPAVGQGALAIETRLNDPRVFKFAKALNDINSFYAAQAERAFLKKCGGDCHTPVAAYAQVLGERINLTGLVVSPTGNPYIKAAEEGPIHEAEAIGLRLAEQLLSRGADKILA